MRGRTALITGSVGGIGYAVARALAAEGCRIMLNGFAAADEIERRRAGLAEAHGVEVAYHGADLADPAQIGELIAATRGRFGGVDILVNNAVVRHFGPIDKYPVEAWDQSLAVNLSAAFHTIRLALPIMRQGGWGRIVNMASVLGQIAADNRVGYVTTKTALIGLTRAVATETIREEITCNAICPGAILTEANAKRIADLAAKEGLSMEAATEKFIAGRQPAGRFVDQDSVAAMVAFLCGPAGRDVTGTALPVDAGWLAGGPSAG